MNFSEGFGEKTIFLVVKKISKSFIQGRGGGGWCIFKWNINIHIEYIVKFSELSHGWAYVEQINNQKYCEPSQHVLLISLLLTGTAGSLKFIGY